MTNSTKRARVLLVAYACRPGESSEREVGWSWANLIRVGHDVTVLTRKSHQVYIEAEVAQWADGEQVPEFIYYDLPGWASWFKRGERGLYLYYALWSLFAIRLIRQLNYNGRWQITHFLTFGTLLWPQFTWLTNTASYVIGPVGGGERIPMSLRKSFSFAGQVKIVIRWAIQRALIVNPIYHATLARADKVFVRTMDTYDLIPKRYHNKTELLLETAILPELLQVRTTVRENRNPEIISVGRLITSKFNPLFLESLAAFKVIWKQPFRVTIIGDGPERARLEELRDKLGLDNVFFVGKKSSEYVLTALSQSDIYFSTTMKEGGTWAFFEAIAYGVPIVCLKVNGPDMIVGDDCGIKVEPSNYHTARDALAEGLFAMASNPIKRAEYAERARIWIEKTYSWKHVAERIDCVYMEILQVEKTGL